MNNEIPEIILASKSPRRYAILKQIGINFTVAVSDIEENHEEFSEPADAVITLSQRKAESVAKGSDKGLVIGADTLVVLDKKILGKPLNKKSAANMLKALSGRTHSVYTGITLIKDRNITKSDFEKTEVTFRNIDDWEIEAYIKTGAPFDKAGAYGIQDHSAVFIKKIQGCFYNVVGFPVVKFYEMLRDMYPNEILIKILDWNDEGIGK